MRNILLDRPLVEANWLKDHLTAPNLIIIDATLPKAVAKDAGAKLVEEQLPHARFLDIQTKFSKTDAIYPNTMLDEGDFNRASRALGIDHDSALVVYDDHGIYSSARAWWMFRSMGHRNVAVLSGGLKNWLELGYPTEKKTVPKTYKGNFTGTYARQFFKNHQQVLDHISNKDALVVDARANDRFQGLVEEPRKGLRSGHIPGSVNLPYTDLLKDEKMLEPLALKALFTERLPEHKNLVFSCGSGITACVLALGAELAGFTNSSVYDGSWTEWGSIPELPIEKGEG